LVSEIEARRPISLSLRLADAYLLPTYTDQTVIANARALREEPLPDELIHRNDKFAHLITSLTSLDGDDAIGDGARIYGPSGAGKTTLARMAARKLEIEMMNVETTRVDCLSHSTMPAALHAVCRQLGIDETFRYRLTPAGKYIDAIDDLDTPTVIIFDEADHLESLDVLHSLYEIPHVAVIIISNREEELLQRAESQTASRIRSGAWIQLDAYSDDELVDILERRVASALVENIVDDSALREMAPACGWERTRGDLVSPIRGETRRRRAGRPSDRRRRRCHSVCSAGRSYSARVQSIRSRTPRDLRDTV